MSTQNNRHKGYYEIGLTYINHRIKVRVFNGETFNSLLHRLFFILSIEREDHLFALKKAESNKLICNNDELAPEDFYQLVVVDDDRQEEVSQFQSPAAEDQIEEPSSVRSKKGTSECRNRTYHGFSINQCYYKSKRPKDETKLLYCPFLSCLKEFSETGNLKTHMRTHTGERPFVCQFEDCGKGFITKGHLKTHLLIHSGEKPFACNFPECNKQYSRSGRLKIHMRTHTGEKPYVCSFSGCSKSFTEKGNLKTHMRIHSGQKPYFCDFEECNKSFTTQGHLTDHKRRHYGDRPFKCEACERTFMRSSTLKKHQEKHKGKCCDISHDDSSFMETYSQPISANIKECSHYNERNNSSGEEENSHYDPREESKDLSSISKNVNSKLRINKEDSLPLSKYNNQRNEESSYLKENSGLKEFNINYSQKESNFKNPFETKDAENVSKNDDPFAPNPTLSMTYSGIKPTMKDPFNIPAMKDPFNMPSMKDPFNVTTTKDPFNMPSMKDPFSGENQKNSFETNEKQNNDMPFKESGLSLGMKTLNSKVQMNPYNLNLLKNCSNSPLGGYLFTGIDGNLANSNRFYKPGVFQTPTSRGVFNPRFADNNERKNETGSFGASPKDISTTKAVFNQQTHFEKGKESEAETPQRAFNRDLHTPSNNYFGNSPAYIYANYQNAFGPNYGNTPTGGSFGASPAAWIFNMPSPYTGYANNYLSPFNQGQQFEPKETNQEQSPKFNSITESNRQPINQYPTGQDSARAFNASLASAFNKLQGIPNYAPSPANAFSFSCVSDSSPMTSNQPYFKFPPKDMNQINKNDSSPRPNQK